MGQKTYSSMDKCMHDWTKDHPKGKGDVSNPHDQAVAVCLSKTGQSNKKKKKKSTNEGMTFKEFWYERNEGTRV